jgi:hypothetical protein
MSYRSCLVESDIVKFLEQNRIVCRTELTGIAFKPVNFFWGNFFLPMPIF